MLSEMGCKALLKQAALQNKAIKKFDGKGLLLLANPNGSGYWRYKYRIKGAEKMLSLGVYPQTSLAEAREKHQAAHKHVSNGVDPIQAKRADEIEALLNASDTFEKMGREWYARREPFWKAKYAKAVKNRLENNLYPEFGSWPVKDLPALVVLTALQKVEDRDAKTIAKKCLGHFGEIMRYCIAKGLNVNDYSNALNSALQKHKVTHHRAMEAKDIPDFAYALERNDPKLCKDTRNLVEMMLHTFVRTNELIRAEKQHFCLTEALWTIPGAWMKMDEDHLVPLSKQMVCLIKKQMDFHPRSKFLFASRISKTGHVSNGTINSALDALGFNKKHTGHGFRALAKSTLMEKLKYSEPVADIQLAHAPKSSLGRAYDRAKFLDDRVQMMQDWSNYIDKCKIIGLSRYLEENQ